MPKLIDYPRTSYTGAWELAEIVDDTGGKCAIETAARKLNRKVSGSFKAIIGSAVKFGLMTSKRDLLTTTTLFKRIKHAYDKNEELQFHREAFLTPPLFTQLCRKFRNRELPVQMLDVMLIREFGVEEINAQSVAKAFIDGCRMCGLIDERNIIADIDALNASRAPRRELSSSPAGIQPFNPTLNSAANNAPQSPPQRPSDIGKAAYPESTVADTTEPSATTEKTYLGLFPKKEEVQLPSGKLPTQHSSHDAIAKLFGLGEESYANEDVPGNNATESTASSEPAQNIGDTAIYVQQTHAPVQHSAIHSSEKMAPPTTNGGTTYQMQMSGPGVNSSLEITEEADIAIAIALLEKIRRQLRLNA